MNINRVTLNALLCDLAQGLHNSNTVMIIGGTAAAMHFCRSIRATEDIDVKLTSFDSSALRKATNQLAKKRNLDDSWLDNNWHHLHTLPAFATQYVIGPTNACGTLSWYWFTPELLVCLYIHSVVDRPSWKYMSLAVQVMLECDLSVTEIKALFSMLYEGVSLAKAECIFDMVVMFKNQVQLNGYALGVAFSEFIKDLPCRDWQRKVKHVIQFMPDKEFYSSIEEICRRYNIEDSIVQEG